MQVIKTTIKSYFMAKIIKTNNTECWPGCDTRPPIHCYDFGKLVAVSDIYHVIQEFS